LAYTHSVGILSLAADAQADSRERALYQLITLSDALSALELEVYNILNIRYTLHQLITPSKRALGVRDGGI